MGAGRPKKLHKRIEIRLDYELYEALQDYCAEYECTRTAAIEAALAYMFDGELSPEDITFLIEK